MLPRPLKETLMDVLKRRTSISPALRAASRATCLADLPDALCGISVMTGRR